MTTFTLGQALIVKETGETVLFREAVAGNQQRGPIVRASPLGLANQSRGYAADAVEAAPALDHRKGYDLQREIEPRLFGWLSWGHMEPLSLGFAVNSISCGCVVWPGVGYIKAPYGVEGAPASHSWTRYFLLTSQGGGYTGEAFALTYGSGAQLENPVLAATVVERAKAWEEALERGDDDKPLLGPLAEAAEALRLAPKVYTQNPTAWRVAICKHEAPDTGSPDQRMRGWHPAVCKLCGMDLSVDSGD